MVVPLWLGCLIAPFFAPDNVLGVYGEIARFGSALFLLIQILSLLEFVYAANEGLVARACADSGADGSFGSDLRAWCCGPAAARAALVGGSALLYAGSLVGIGFMFALFAPAASCAANICFIAFTLVAALGYTALSLHPQARARALLLMGWANEPETLKACDRRDYL